ncbi:ChaN family lipoprotein [Psychromarinibacter sp. S121]|uniref:ChaN family lipoprotein n=1 Tax=Psychromarinibacter sp. S121 TaxID=3415127 RepID=UPI003C7BD8F1
MKSFGITVTAAVLSAAVSFAGPALAAEVTAADLTDLARADIVVLGEVHDNPQHHLNQAAVVGTGYAAVVFEMLTPEQAAGWDPALAGDAEALGAALQWSEGWPDFAVYHPIFEAAGDAAIYGAALPREEVRRSISEGAASVFGAGAGDYGLDLPLPGDEAAVREADLADAHCGALPEEMLPGMLEAQRLRDAAFAKTALMALKQTGGPVAVITGNGHARRDWGLPRALASAAPDVTVLTLGQFEDDAPDVPPFDLWLVTEAAEREDPCAAFNQ